MQFCAAFILIIIGLLDIIFQLIFGFINPISMGDDAIILILAIIFLYYSFQRRTIARIWIGIINILIWFIGFPLRGMSMMYIIDKKISEMNSIYIMVKTGVLFFCIPLTCNKKNNN